MTVDPKEILKSFVSYDRNTPFIGIDCSDVYWVRHCRPDGVQIGFNHNESYNNRVTDITELATRLAVGYYVGTHTKDHCTTTSDCLTCALEGTVKAVSTVYDIHKWVYNNDSATTILSPKIILDPLICSEEDREIFEVSALPIPYWQHAHEAGNDINKPNVFKLSLITDPCRVWGIFCPERPAELFDFITSERWVNLSGLDQEIRRNMLKSLETFKIALDIFVRILVGEVDYKDPHVFDEIGDSIGKRKCS